MPTYRLLTLEELELFKEEFVRFLAVQGISGNDWVNWQKINPEKCSYYIDQFSEYIFIQVLEKIEIMARYSERLRQYIQFEDKILTFISIQEPSETGDNDKIALENCEVVKGTKTIGNSLHDEKFNWLKQGFVPLKKDNLDEIRIILNEIKNM